MWSVKKHSTGTSCKYDRQTVQWYQTVPNAALAAALATRGSTTDARKATVDMIGLPCCENGTGWYTSGPRWPPEPSSSRYGSSIGRRRKCRMHSSCVRLPTCSATRFQSSLYISRPSSSRRVSWSVHSRLRVTAPRSCHHNTHNVHDRRKHTLVRQPPFRDNLGQLALECN